MDQNKKAVLSTLIYSDIFDYPLTEEEMRKYCPKKFSLHEISKLLTILLGGDKVFSYQGYYYLRERENIIQKRIEREKISNNKLYLAKKIIRLLQLIPTIRLIGISGSLAMNNAKQQDDIDIFIVSSQNTIWTTRFFVLILLQLIGRRRRWNDQHGNDNICANMFIDEKNLVLPIMKQNFFTAHEIIQLKPIFDKNNTYQKFIFANNWVKKYLPSTKISQVILPTRSQNPSWIENIFKSLQLWYMQKHRTTERITDTILAFHPDDQEKKVLEQYKNKLDEYAI